MDTNNSKSTEVEATADPIVQRLLDKDSSTLMNCYYFRVKYFGKNIKSDGVDDSFSRDKFRVIMSSSALYSMVEREKIHRINFVNATFCVYIVPPGEQLPPPPKNVLYYLVIDMFATQDEANNLINYLNTDFVHYLVSLCNRNKGLCNDVFRCVPVLDFTKPWDDNRLYQEYELTPGEIALIQSVRRKCKMESE